MDFTEKRTLRAKTLGTAAVGPGSLLAKKKLRCRACGAYNDVGSAKPYRGKDGGAESSADVPPLTDSGPIYAPSPVDPVKVKSMLSSITFDGETITIRDVTKSVTRLEDLRRIVVREWGGLWIGAAGATPPDMTMKGFATDPNAIVFSARKRPEIDALVASIEEHRIAGR